MSPIILTIILAVLVLFLTLRSTVFASPTGTYETSIINKKVQNTVIYTGVFVPIKQHVLETAELRNITVKKHQYDRVNVGDRVTVTRYSNGRHVLRSIT